MRSIDISTRLGISPDEAMAVGDGANDLGMLHLAGAGVALHAKPVVAVAGENPHRPRRPDRPALYPGLPEDGFRFVIDSGNDTAAHPQLAGDRQAALCRNQRRPEGDGILPAPTLAARRPTP